MSLLSTKLTARLWVTAVTIGVAFAASLFLVHRVGSVEIRPTRHSIAQLPMTIGSFTGVDHEMDPQVAKRVGATESISRKYTNPSGVEISLFVATFTALGEPTLPHPPAICYPASGWRTVADEPVAIDGMSRPARVLTVDRDGSRSLVLYWYCWDEDICTTRGEAVMARLKRVGRSQWPPLVKVLLEMPLGRSPDASLELLTGFAGRVREETKDL